MKKYKFNTIIPILSVLVLGSCSLDEKDNYQAPDSSIHGGVYDVETGNLVEQDIINGMQIEYIEHGFDNPEIQYMLVKNDGSYRNDQMFAGTYTIQPVRGNFVPVEEQTVEVEGNTQKNFVVRPFIRVKNVTIEKQDNKIVAIFNLEQTVTNQVNKIGLFAHEEPNVGNSLNSVSSIMDINAVSNEVTRYRLEINLDAYGSALQSGKQYYFRVGALIDVPEAKFNYAPAIRLDL